MGQYALPKTCFEVRDASQLPLFQVCDNDFQGEPSTHAACEDATDRQGYRFVGEAEIHESGEVYDQVSKKIPPAVKPRAAVLVRVKEVCALGGAQVGEKIL